MFRFEEPAYLYLLLLLPLLAAFYLYSNYRRRKAIRKFGDPILMAQLMPDVSKYRPDVKVLVGFVGYRVVHGTAGTSAVWFQTGDGKTPGSGSDDCVGYIQFHAGTRRTAKPLAEGKRLVAQLVDKMQNDKVGMIVLQVTHLPSCLLRVIIFLPRCFGVHRPFADFQARYGNWSCNKSGCPEFYTSRRSGTYCYCHHRR